MTKNLLSFVSIIIMGTACSSQQSSNNSGSNLPAVNPNSINGQVYMKAKAEFDISSAPDGSAQFNLVKKSYAAAPNCTHGQCTDYSDITVTNNGLTQFSLSNDNPIIQGTDNQNITVLGNLKIGTLFDNNLTSCGGKKCISAAIRIYTTDSTGVQGPGLYDALIGQSVALTISGGSSNSVLAPIPYFSAAGTPDDGSSLQIDLDPLASDKNVLSLQMADFSDASPSGAGYNLSANFTQAGSGIYKAHVVVEYDLIGPASTSSPTPIVLTMQGNGTTVYKNGVAIPQLPNTNACTAEFIPRIAADSQGNKYIIGTDSNCNAAVWKNGQELSPYQNAANGSAPSGGFLSIMVNGNNDVYVIGYDVNNQTAYWKNGQENIVPAQNVNGIFVTSAGQVFISGQSTNGQLSYWNNGVQHLLSQALSISSDDIAVDSHSNVYIVGYDSNDNNVVWKNGAELSLYPNSSDGNDNSDAGFTGVAVDSSGNNLYVIGYDLNGDNAVWLNGTEQALYPNSSDEGDEESFYDVAVDGSGKVYVVGYDLDENAAVWINGAETVLPDGEQAVAVSTNGSNYYVFGFDEDSNVDIWVNGSEEEPTIQNGATYAGNLIASAVDSSGNIYVAGQDFNGAGAYWMNGVETTISGASYAQAIAVNSGKVYVAGRNSIGQSAYWVNGVETVLANGEGYGGRVFMAISGSDVYIGEPDNSGIWSIWKNGTELAAYQGSGPNTNFTELAVDNQGHVYVSGLANNTATIWKDGVEQAALTNQRTASHNNWVATDSQGNVFVLGEDTSNNAGVWKNGTETVLQHGPQASPTDIAVDSLGNVFVSGLDGSTGNSTVWENEQVTFGINSHFNSYFQIISVFK